MSEEQVEQLLTELHELNKTFKAIASSLERSNETVLTKNVYVNRK
ncbi:hypothetical protein [Lactiplantibacillus plantarum]